MRNVTRVITTQEAQLKTATVEVRSLTINGKQMTLSVFRQIQQEPILDERTGLLKGIPWGKVNYFWGDCTPNHLHIVWQWGQELRRACVYSSWDRRMKEDYEYKIGTIESILAQGGQLIVYLSLLQEPERQPVNRKWLIKWGKVNTQVNEDQVRPAYDWWDRNTEAPRFMYDRQRKTIAVDDLTKPIVHRPGSIMSMFGKEKEKYEKKWVPESDEQWEARLWQDDAKRLEKVREEVARLTKELQLPKPPLEQPEPRAYVKEWMQEDCETWLRLRQEKEEALKNGAASYQMLVDIDHLFIAV